MHKPDGLQAFEKPLSVLPQAMRQLILDRLNTLTHYEPVIGIMGKRGSGKSSLCNALFRGEVSPVSNVNACTRDALRFRLRSGRHSLVIVDLPGVGESRKRDDEYSALYSSLLPELDLILWIIKADDRAMSVDEDFYQHVIQHHQHKVMFVVNQVDKAEPCHEWDTSNQRPSSRQWETINEKKDAVQQLFRPNNPVCLVSARTGWGLEGMVETMMSCLPDNATSPLITQLNERYCTDAVKKQASDGFSQSVGRVFDAAVAAPLLAPSLQKVIHTVRNTVVSVARAVWRWIFC